MSVREDTHWPILTYKHPARSISRRSHEAYPRLDGINGYNGTVAAMRAIFRVLMAACIIIDPSANFFLCDLP